ncbi:hypothetical protein [Novosphingobium olei]|uniref:Uncharacterized protein n=1 Tax=Novosphingobium olei TaxID=2728851 RepID=A0A7Y0BMS5_9SPHN|nr:hypothetical protein [Novosphingobium olei]NML93153.1 hypothetical protein [Novosphingobium olei]
MPFGLCQRDGVLAVEHLRHFPHLFGIGLPGAFLPVPVLFLVALLVLIDLEFGFEHGAFDQRIVDITKVFGKFQRGDAAGVFDDLVERQAQRAGVWLPGQHFAHVDIEIAGDGAAVLAGARGVGIEPRDMGEQQAVVVAGARADHLPAKPHRFGHAVDGAIGEDLARMIGGAEQRGLPPGGKACIAPPRDIGALRRRPRRARREPHVAMFGQRQQERPTLFGREGLRIDRGGGALLRQSLGGRGGPLRSRRVVWPSVVQKGIAGEADIALERDPAAPEGTGPRLRAFP